MKKKKNINKDINSSLTLSIQVSSTSVWKCMATCTSFKNTNDAGPFLLQHGSA